MNRSTHGSASIPTQFNSDKEFVYGLWCQMCDRRSLKTNEIDDTQINVMICDLLEEKDGVIEGIDVRLHEATCELNRMFDTNSDLLANIRSLENHLSDVVDKNSKLQQQLCVHYRENKRLTSKLHYFKSQPSTQPDPTNQELFEEHTVMRSVKPTSSASYSVNPTKDVRGLLSHNEGGQPTSVSQDLQLKLIRSMKKLDVMSELVTSKTAELEKMKNNMLAKDKAISRLKSKPLSPQRSVKAKQARSLNTHHRVSLKNSVAQTEPSELDTRRNCLAHKLRTLKERKTNALQKCFANSSCSKLESELLGLQKIHWLTSLVFCLKKRNMLLQFQLACTKQSNACEQERNITVREYLSLNTSSKTIGANEHLPRTKPFRSGKIIAAHKFRSERAKIHKHRLTYFKLFAKRCGVLVNRLASEARHMKLATDTKTSNLNPSSPPRVDAQNTNTNAVPKPEVVDFLVTEITKRDKHIEHLESSKRKTEVDIVNMRHLLEETRTTVMHVITNKCDDSHIAVSQQGQIFHLETVVMSLRTENNTLSHRVDQLTKDLTKYELLYYEASQGESAKTKELIECQEANHQILTQLSHLESNAEFHIADTVRRSNEAVASAHQTISKGQGLLKEMEQLVKRLAILLVKKYHAVNGSDKLSFSPDESADRKAEAKSWVKECVNLFWAHEKFSDNLIRLFSQKLEQIISPTEGS